MPERTETHLHAALLGVACLLPGCGAGDDTTSPAPAVGAAANVSCPGVDLTGQYVVTVSTQGSDGLICGGVGGSAPCRTIGKGLAVAGFFEYRAVVVRHGLYRTTETLQLKNGVNVHGSCLFDGEPDRKYRTVIQANPAPGTPAISADAVVAAVSGLVVIGKDETASGPSIAMTAGNSSLTLRRTVLVAGKGGPGAAPPSLAVATGVRSALDTCYRPGGAASGLLWGQVDLQGFDWVPGIGGAGAGGAYDTGPGGVGGQQGGASIGLLLVNSDVPDVASEFNRVMAGAGGVGGAGQAGPSFGLGGGANSGGAGGNGGPSIGLALTGSSTAPGSDFYVYAGAPGTGGAYGAAGVDQGQCSGDPGAPGVQGGSAAIYRYQAPSTLASGESLAAGQSLYSPNLQYKLTLSNSTLCLSSAAGSLWCSPSGGQGIYQAIMQGDGNMCMYETQGQFRPVCSGSAGHPGAHLAVQDGGHAQVIDADGVAWWTVP